MKGFECTLGAIIDRGLLRGPRKRARLTAYGAKKRDRRERGSTKFPIKAADKGAPRTTHHAPRL